MDKVLLPDRQAIERKLLADEPATVAELARRAALSEDQAKSVDRLARKLVQAVRKGRHQQGGIDAFMQEYSLSSEEGVVLMCLAEALLRIPDADTADKLIADKIGGKRLASAISASRKSLFVNASAWGLMLTGRFVELGRDTKTDFASYLERLVIALRRAGHPPGHAPGHAHHGQAVRAGPHH